MYSYSSGQRLRFLGADKGIDARGWTWEEEEGSATLWEDPVALGARHISARLTRSNLFAITRRFGVDIEAMIANRARQATAL